MNLPVALRCTCRGTCCNVDDRPKAPVSTSQAVVGGIVGWNLFTGSPTDMASLSKIISTWVVCPLLSAAFAYVLYQAITMVVRRSRMHILHMDAYTRHRIASGRRICVRIHWAPTILAMLWGCLLPHPPSKTSMYFIFFLFPEHSNYF